MHGYLHTAATGFDSNFRELELTVLQLRLFTRQIHLKGAL